VYDHPERGRSMVWIVIMAGGKGERFWPKSVADRPKQFHRIVSEKTMLQETHSRIHPEIKNENICVVAGRRYRELILEQLPGLPAENIIEEPQGKNTAAAIGLSAVELRRKDPGGTMVVLTADHLISPKRRLLQALEAAVKVAEDGYLVTFGISPDRPATEYGYIETGERIHGKYGLDVFGVKMFREKPSREKAVEYLAEGTFLWNSGMFAFTLENILRALETYMPPLHGALAAIGRHLGTSEEERVKREEFAGLQSVSVDYGIMEKATNIACLKPSFEWDDVGSWSALSRHRETDADGNILEGNVVSIDSRNNVVVGEESSLVSLVGVSDLIVVKDGPRLLVCHRSKDQRVKELVGKLSVEEKYSSFR
jgi:mannose-1-phosphate guanylyltransferase